MKNFVFLFLLVVIPAHLLAQDGYQVIRAEITEGHSLHVPSENKTVKFENLILTLAVDSTHIDFVNSIEKRFCQPAYLQTSAIFIEFDNISGILQIRMKAFEVGRSQPSVKKTWEDAYQSWNKGELLNDFKELTKPIESFTKASMYYEAIQAKTENKNR